MKAANVLVYSFEGDGGWSWVTPDHVRVRYATAAEVDALGEDPRARIARSERFRDARVALEPDEMPEPHDFERVAPYVFGQPERTGKDER